MTENDIKEIIYFVSTVILVMFIWWRLQNEKI